MIDHVTIYVKNLSHSKEFYEKAFAPLEYKISFGEENIFWAFDTGQRTLFEIAQSPDAKEVSPCHIAFRVETREQINDFHSQAIAAGAKDNGPPGPRPQYTENYYACFVLDPDGHNIEAMLDHEN